MTINFLLGCRQRTAHELTVAIRKDPRRSESRFADIKIGIEIANQLGWKKGDKALVGWGEDEDIGCLVIQRTNEKGSVSLHWKSAVAGSPTVKYGVPDWLTDLSGAVVCPHKVTLEDSAIVAQLPAKFAEQYTSFQRARDQGRKASLDPDQPVAMPARADSSARVSAEPDGRATSESSDSLKVRETASIAGAEGSRVGPGAQEMHPVRIGTAPVNSQREIITGADLLAAVNLFRAAFSNDEWTKLRARHGLAGKKATEITQATRLAMIVEIEARLCAQRNTQEREGHPAQAGADTVDAPTTNQREVAPPLDRAEAGRSDRSDLDRDGGAPPLAAASVSETRPAAIHDRLVAPAWLGDRDSIPRALAMLERCANAGQPVPSNPVLRVVSGVKTDAHVSHLLNLMAERGLIEIERFPARQKIGRIVTICATGQKTFDPRLAGDGPGNGASMGPARDIPTNSPAPDSLSQSQVLPSGSPRDVSSASLVPSIKGGRDAEPAASKAGVQATPAPINQGGDRALVADMAKAASPPAPAGNGSSASESTRTAREERPAPPTRDLAEARPSKPTTSQPTPITKRPPGERSGGSGGPVFGTKGGTADARGKSPVAASQQDRGLSEQEQIAEFMRTKGVVRMALPVNGVADSDQAIAALEKLGKTIRKHKSFVMVDGQRVAYRELVGFTNNALRQGNTVRVKPGDPVPFESAEKAALYCRDVLKDKVIRIGDSWLLNGGADLTDAQLVSHANRALSRGMAEAV